MDLKATTAAKAGGAQGRRDRRYRGRPLQGHGRPGSEPADQDHQHRRADDRAVAVSFRLIATQKADDLSAFCLGIKTLCRANLYRA